MAGHELVTEGFAPGQVGSSAMPHKMNTRSCERVNGLQVVLRGYASMAAELAGRAMERGRRVLLGGAPGRAARRVLRDRRADRDVPDGARRVRRLSGGDPARTRPLSAVPGHHPDPDRGGARGDGPGDGARGDQGARGRGRAGDAGEGCWSRTCWTGWPPIRGCRWTGAALDAALADKQAFTGAAGDQVDAVVDAVDELVSRYPEAAKYTSGAIL